ncbi:hypothetical protein F511_15141 [Dorcoceras hygrometricum]|uniref:Uncharacterized protein n=1 Tax=Dorcoceras hygrometricum TaxID=472368 RepID=A0A2Z7B4V6_9LAMI|nr:hypothetical protein F511_15141 [Dorcoceras hygrometricum]
MDDPDARDKATSYRKKYPIASYSTTSRGNLKCRNDVPVASYSGSSRRLHRVATSRQRIQSRATVDPVVGYCALHIQSTGKPDAKNPDAVFEESTSSKAVDKLQRVTKAGCQLLSLIQMLKTTKSVQKKGHKGQSLSVLYRTHFKWEEFCVQRIELEQRPYIPSQRH